MKKILLCIFALLLTIALTACDNNEFNYEGMAKVIYHLEGGSSQQTLNQLSHIYEIDENTNDTLIIDPNVILIPERQIVRTGYTLEGWYLKNADGTWGEKWDFATNRVTLDGIHLYAKWIKNTIYKYVLYHQDGDKEVLLSEYSATVGDKLDPDLFMNNQVKGYTTIGYLDENGNPWDDSYQIPDTDTDVIVKVYVDLIKGEYEVVKTVNDFKKAISTNKNIYLANDIDYDGKLLRLNNYKGILNGGGHKIHNAIIDVKAERLDGKTELIRNEEDGLYYLYLSLFKKLENATIQNVSFENITYRINTTRDAVQAVLFAPLALDAINTKIENVHLSLKVEITKGDLTYEEYLITNQYFHKQDSDTTIDSNSTLNVEVNN